MSDSETKRVRRSPEERAAEIDAKREALCRSIAETEEKKQASAAAFDKRIASLREKIRLLEAKRKEILAPKQRRPRRTKKRKIEEIMKQAQRAGMRPEEIAERLGIALQE